MAGGTPSFPASRVLGARASRSHGGRDALLGNSANKHACKKPTLLRPEGGGLRSSGCLRGTTLRRIQHAGIDRRFQGAGEAVALAGDLEACRVGTQIRAAPRHALVGVEGDLTGVGVAHEAQEGLFGGGAPTRSAPPYRVMRISLSPLWQSPPPSALRGSSP